jgi:two-component system, OmpR family, response regulator RegX3
MNRILVVDDESSFRDALTVGLSREGFEVVEASTGPEALLRFHDSDPQLVLLDVMLPGMSGTDVCREIRKTSKVPIIMLTARGDEIDAVVGLEVGADDYVTKPYRLRELVARIGAVLRRGSEALAVDGDAPPATSTNVLRVAGVELDRDRHELRVDGVLVAMALKEFELLAFLMDHAGRVVTRDSLMDNVWDLSYVGDTKTLDVHVKRVRAKIDTDPAVSSLISTVRGVGYRFETG